MTRFATHPRPLFRTRDEGGYVLVTVAFSMVVLMLIAALTVDVGGWFSRGSQIQRAADAAALAGVPYMPDIATATNVALSTATKNGFTDGQKSVSVVVSAIAGNPHQLQVTVTDGNVPRYFSGLVLSNKTITHTAIAEYDPAVPMGSPKNTFGTGDLLSSPDTEHIWAAASGWCSGRENGDLLLAGYDQAWSNSNGTNGSWTCPGRTSNPTADPTGYYYAIEVPPNAAGKHIHLDLYDPAYDCGDPDSDLQGGCSSNVTTTFKLLGPDATSFDRTDNPVLQTTTFSSGSTTYKNAWDSFWSGTADVGTYYLEVYTKAGESNSAASNGFSIRSYVGGTFKTCSTITTAPDYNARCPQVHAVDDMSIFASQAGSTAVFYLASLDPAYGGKTMTVSLFDPGEGAQSIQVLDPNSNPVSFSWSTACGNGIANATGGCSGSGSSLDVSGTSGMQQPYPYTYPGGRFNDRLVTIQVALPSNYASLYGTNTWWRVKYTTTNSSVTDRTTWAVTVNANPIHLVS